MQKYKIVALLALALCGRAASADVGGDVLSVDAGGSSVAYQIVHKLHKFRGVSKRVEGKGKLLPDGKVQVMVRVPVESFDSGNVNRDAHMKETLEAAKFPNVELKAAGDGVTAPATFPAVIEKTFKGELTFHGVKQAIDIPVKITFEGAGRVKALVHLNLKLEDFKVERPSLMFVKIDNEMQVDADLVFKK